VRAFSVDFLYQFHHGPGGGLRTGISAALLAFRYDDAIKIMTVERRLDVPPVEIVVVHVGAVRPLMVVLRGG